MKKSTASQSSVSLLYQYQHRALLQIEHLGVLNIWAYLFYFIWLRPRPQHNCDLQPGSFECQHSPILLSGLNALQQSPIVVEPAQSHPRLPETVA